MRRAVALLAAALALAGIVSGCGGGGAEPGAPIGASLVLDFTPNAVHSGIYAAQAEGFYGDVGIDLTVHAPGESTDAPKLLAAGRTDFAILDITDLAIARQKGLPLVGVMPIVNAPLAAILARGDKGIASPADLDGKEVGVTGLPSDEAVVDSEVSAAGGDPAAVKRVTIGFTAVPSLAAGKVDAATGFWNAEGVALQQKGIPLNVFKLDEFGAPQYPELILTTTEKELREHPGAVLGVAAATGRGYRFAESDPKAAISDLLAADSSLGKAEQDAQLQALLPSLKPQQFDPKVLNEWAAWARTHDLIHGPLDVEKTFDQTASRVDE
jgi:putative hydroxymethylpyrimidine transport system substrate-binding protein